MIKPARNKVAAKKYMKQFFITSWQGLCLMIFVFGMAFLISAGYYLAKFLNIERHIKEMRQYEDENDESIPLDEEY